MNHDLPYPFLMEIRKVAPKIIGVKPFLYVIRYNNFKEAKDYKRHLDTLLSNFNHRLTFVPNNFSIENYKVDHVSSLHRYIRSLQEDVIRDQGQLVTSKYPACKICKKLGKLIPQNLIREQKKLYLMFEIQKRYIQRSIEILEPIAIKNNVAIANTFLEPIFNNRFKTNLTNDVLSVFFKLVFDVITENNYNKSDLSRLLSSSFETKRTKTPSEKKLYYFFSNSNPETKEKVKKLIFELKLVAQE